MDWSIYIYLLGGLAAIAAGTWIVSLVLEDVSIVDSIWSLMFLVVAIGYFLMASPMTSRAWLMLILVAVWATRLSAYITIRNHGEPEDRRYRKIRASNQPYFRFKSLYLVFGLQALLAGVIALPLAAAMAGDAPLGWLDATGLLLWCGGMFFEVVGDAQLARFKRESDSGRDILDEGLWRYTRHPNYFGEFMLWWGYYLIAVAAGGWWTILSPVLMTVLLLRISGVALLEKDIGDRRPAYDRYVRRTNAFFPGPPKAVS